ncbi:MAG: hypothetical protein VX467_07915 [Verrucomicrobiota bacterium]|nr:hypothetical protein [Verrucomicrobiota bacterium]
MNSKDLCSHFDSNVRAEALRKEAAEEDFPPPTTWVNAHAHTFYSFNYMGYSPSRFALEAKKAGLEMGGIVDFDVLDGLEEFWQASRLLDLKACVGIESRVFVPEFADRVINSPGEPGISYHMGTGFTTTEIPTEAQTFLDGMRQTSEGRNRAMVERVNMFLSPLELNYEDDVMPLVPKGNATERHLCLAYARKAAAQFPEENDLRSFWSEKLGVSGDELKDVPDGRGMTDLIRAKTMKQGGAGYVQPDSGSFPKMAEMNEFVLQCGALPTMTWLDGCSAGEESIEELLEVARSTGVAVFNVIPDRNYTPGSPDQKLANLQKVVDICKDLEMPLLGGTEMNSPGQKFVDNFDSDELKPMHSQFLEGSRILHAHSTLQRLAGMGYLSPWADDQFATTSAKNEFYGSFGEIFSPRGDNALQNELKDSLGSEEVISLVESIMST